MSIERHIGDAKVVICAGSGGVGKTTTSAAIAIGLAERGRHVALVTIDPARRLADALGIADLGNEPQRVALEGDGELWAMMLDPKRTLDELIGTLSSDESQRDEILANPIYRELSQAVAGSQEFTAVAKLHELHRSGRFDAIVLDTPPSRNALDFLDAPDRLTGFLEGRALRAFLAPAGIAGRIAARGTGVVFAVLERVTGVDLLRDLSTFFGALGGVLDGFRERAAAVKALLADPATTFLIVTSPQREAVEEAIFFRGKLREAGLPFGGLVVNRLHPLAARPDDRTPGLDDALARKARRTLEEFRVLATRDAAAIERLRKEIDGGEDPLLVPQLDGDVHDVPALHAVRDWLFADSGERDRRLDEIAY